MRQNYGPSIKKKNNYFNHSGISMCVYVTKQYKNSSHRIFFACHLCICILAFIYMCFFSHGNHKSVKNHVLFRNYIEFHSLKNERCGTDPQTRQKYLKLSNNKRTNKTLWAHEIFKWSVAYTSNLSQWGTCPVQYFYDHLIILSILKLACFFPFNNLKTISWGELKEREKPITWLVSQLQNRSRC